MARSYVRDTFYCAYVKKRHKNTNYISEASIGPYDTIGVAQSMLTRETNDITRYGNGNVELLVGELRKGTVTWEVVDPKAEKLRIKLELAAAKKAKADAVIKEKEDIFWAEFNG